VTQTWAGNQNSLMIDANGNRISFTYRGAANYVQQVQTIVALSPAA